MINLFKIIGSVVIRLTNEIKYYKYKKYIKKQEQGLKIFKDYKP
tara:strand:+ start:1537 stop:1668 length:132 start_codon:yes stop_codon:yes gene_type:complete